MIGVGARYWMIPFTWVRYVSTTNVVIDRTLYKTMLLIYISKFSYLWQFRQFALTFDLLSIRNGDMSVPFAPLIDHFNFS